VPRSRVLISSWLISPMSLRFLTPCSNSSPGARNQSLSSKSGAAQFAGGGSGNIAARLSGLCGPASAENAGGNVV